MTTVLIVSIALGIVWAAVSALVAFFVIGPSLPRRGATPLFGAEHSFYLREHETELAAYRAERERTGKSLIWWRVVRYSLYGVPTLVFIALASGILAGL